MLLSGGSDARRIRDFESIRGKKLNQRRTSRVWDEEGREANISSTEEKAIKGAALHKNHFTSCFNISWSVALMFDLHGNHSVKNGWVELGPPSRTKLPL